MLGVIFGSAGRIVETTGVPWFFVGLFILIFFIILLKVIGVGGEDMFMFLLLFFLLVSDLVLFSFPSVLVIPILIAFFTYLGVRFYRGIQK